MGIRRNVKDFFTNWSDYDGPLPTKLKMTFRNRARAMTRGCCGHPGEPGC